MDPSFPPAAAQQPVTPSRQRFLHRLAALSIHPAAREYYVRWAEAWIKAHGNRSADTTAAYFAALGRSAHLADWQFRQAVDAVRILAHDILTLPWAAAFKWHSLADQARSLGASHRTLAREAIPITASSTGVGTLLASLQPEIDPAAELSRLIDSLRRAIRLKNLAVATEETYVHWSARFIRFCFQKLAQHPAAAGPAAITAYLDYLALERNVAVATQKQALNALVFLTREVFHIREFTLEQATPARGPRRPPVVMTREEVRSVIAHLEDP